MWQWKSKTRHRRRWMLVYAFQNWMSTELTCISLSAFAACSWWRLKALGFLFTTISTVLFLHAILFVPHLQLLEHSTEAFLQGQPGFFAVFLRLHEFLQAQVCDGTKHLLWKTAIKKNNNFNRARSRGKCGFDLPLDSRSPKGQRWKLFLPIPRSFARVVQQETASSISTTSTSSSWSISPILEGTRLWSLDLSARVRIAAGMKTRTKARKVLWLGGIL